MSVEELGHHICSKGETDLIRREMHYNVKALRASVSIHFAETVS